MNKLILFFLFVTIYNKPRDVDIVEDFSLDVEFALEKTDNKWKKRGVITFQQKGSNKNYRSFAKIANNELSNEENILISQECERQGTYIIRVKKAKSYLYSSLPACDLVNMNLNDKIIFNYINSVKQDHIISINYDRNHLYNDKNNKGTLGKSFNTQIEFVETRPSLPPLFPEEKEEVKGGPQEQEKKSFFQQYWWLIMIVVAMMILKAPEDGAPAGSNPSS